LKRRSAEGQYVGSMTNTTIRENEREVLANTR